MIDTLPEELAILLCYHRNKDYVEGLEHDTSFVKGLSAYCRFKSYLEEYETIEVVSTAAYWKGVLESTADKIDKLISEAKTDEERRTALGKVLDLQEILETAKANLEKLNG